MVAFVNDRVCETSTTTGTGDLTLAGAVTGFQTFANANIDSTGELYYLIEAVDGSGVPTGDWETGIGLLSTSTTLQRLVVLASSNSGSAVSLAAGTKRVHLTAPAHQLQLLGTSCTMTSNLTAQNFTTAAAIAWNHNAFTSWDGTSFHDTVTNNTRITIPASGYDPCEIRLSGAVNLQNATVGDWAELSIRANGTTTIARNTSYLARTTSSVQVISPIYTSASADYFELLLQISTDTSVDVLATQSFFQIEVLQ